MKISSSFVLSAMLASIASVSASDLEARAITCDAANAMIAGATNGQVLVNAYCRSYMGITARTVTATVNSVRATRTVTQAAYTTTTLPITPATRNTVVTQKTTSFTTTTPAISMTTNTVTSTAYLANSGETIAIAKRDTLPEPSQFAKRAVPVSKPAFLTGYSNNDLKAICRCQTIPRATVTRTITKGIYATVTKTASRKLILTTTLPTPISISTLTNVLTRIATAPAPTQIINELYLDQVRGCPPGTSTLFLCPAGTSDDDGSDPNFETCGVVANDGYQGSCQYWADDGEPFPTTLTLGDGSGDPANDTTRPATYGDSDEDDCPSWADWTCPTSSGQKRSLIERLSFQKRASSKRRTKRPFYGTKRKNHTGKKAIPYPAPARGGSYIPYSEYLAELAARNSTSS